MSPVEAGGLLAGGEAAASHDPAHVAGLGCWHGTCEYAEQCCQSYLAGHGGDRFVDLVDALILSETKSEYTFNIFYNLCSR